MEKVVSTHRFWIGANLDGGSRSGRDVGQNLLKPIRVGDRHNTLKFRWVRRKRFLTATISPFNNLNRSHPGARSFLDLCWDCAQLMRLHASAHLVGHATAPDGNEVLRSLILHQAMRPWADGKC